MSRGFAGFMLFIFMVAGISQCGSVPVGEPTTAPIEPTTSVIETIPSTPAASLPIETTNPTSPTTLPTAPTEPPINFEIFDVPENYHSKDFKSYESWKAITAKNTPHYKLQNEYAYTNTDGIRMVDGRYCIALGSYFTTAIGQYIDIILENGTVIECILGDQKADIHTDNLHIAHPDGSVVEFIVDVDKIPTMARRMGNMAYAHDEWKSPVVQIIVYDINYFNIQ
jgi:hypothetical protein